ncbi:MAG: aspartate aminotransferase family protein [Bacteroidales bacterium]|nr:aspartate aminotransferase family protein [Bacteroidales bacterium]
MNNDEFRKNAHELVDWMADYLSEVDSYPVKSQVNPGEILSALPIEPPSDSESMEKIMTDVNSIIMPGISHWQSPNFYAYFPANSSYPSILGEMLTATLGVQGMIWDTSPAAAELEELMMEWLKKMMGLPSDFHGVIQDTASTSTLVALLTARERISEYQTNAIGYLTNEYRIYCSTEAHSSVEKAVKIAGFGKEALVKIEVDKDLKMIPEKLEEALKCDIMEGLIPCFVVSAVGSTGTVAIDPIDEIGDICNRYKVWHHVDAAYAGTATILEENRHIIKGLEKADSYVFNPHKWMFTNFDCSAYFVKDKEALIRTFEILPEYLKTNSDSQVNNYRDWGIQLGRRFRSLKLWFVIRSMGVNGIKEKISNHIHWAKELAEWVKADENFVLHEPQNLACVCFRLKNKKKLDIDEFNSIGKILIDRINNSGKLYISHTKVHGEFTFRFVIGNTYVTKDHIVESWNYISSETKKYLNEL